MALIIKKNSINMYLYNTVNARVVTPNVPNSNVAGHILNLIPDEYYDTVSYDPTVRYLIRHRSVETPATYSSVSLGKEHVRLFANGLASRSKAEKWVEELQKYGIRLV